MITDINQLDFSKEYTYSDYLTWQFKERVELIKGRIFKMSPAPNRKHQAISWTLTVLIGNYLRKKTCQAFTAPFDVRLLLPKDKVEGDKISTVVQPDITVVCDESKLDEQGCNGVPDLVIEILSPGNSKREMKDKYRLYENAGIQEYWLIDPDREFVTIYSLNDQGKYIGSEPFTNEDVVRSSVLKGLEIDLSEVF
jgi:Uma2 family endonuclease